MSTYILSGAIQGITLSASIQNLRIEAWDVDGVFDLPVGVATTNGDGRFELRLTDQHLKEVFGARPPTVYFRVIENQEALLANTCGKQTWSVRSQPRQTITIRVANEAVGTVSSETNQVFGRVALTTSPDGKTVKIFDARAADDDIELATTSLGDDGRYLATYSDDAVTENKERPDIIVRVFDGMSNPVTSEVFFQAPPSLRVDLTEDGVAPDDVHTSLTAALAPVLGTGALTALQDDAAIELAAGSARTTVDRVRRLVDAATVTNTMNASGTPPSQQAIFGMLQQGIAADRDAILRLPEATKQSILERAEQAGDASFTVASEVAKLRAETVARMQEGTTNLDALVEKAGITDGGVRQNFLTAFASHSGTMADFWSSLSVTGIGATEKADIQLFFQVAAVTRNYFPMVDILKTQRGLTTPTWTNFDDLATWTTTDWVDAMDTMVPPTPGDNDEEKRLSYAKLLVATMENIYPTAAMKAWVNRTAPGSDRDTFFTANPSFDFRANRVHDFFEAGVSGLTQLQQDAVRPQLERMERMLKVSPQTAHMAFFEEQGFGSAAAVARCGWEKFESLADSAGISSEEAKAMHDISAKIASASESLVAYLDTNLGAAVTLAEASVPQSNNQGTLGSQWEHYFGSPSRLDCDRCASIHGPAAYLVDTLVWLDQFSSLTIGTSAQDVLLLRRPDIERIELSCDTTNERLPYIDIVNEILERQVSATQPAAALITTTGDEADRLAIPDVLYEADNRLAYNTLGTAAVYPWLLPFSLWGEQARTYLKHMGVERHELMRLMQASATPTDTLIAREYFGMSREMYNALGNTGGNTHWGLSATEMVNGQSVSWHEALSNAGVLSAQGGLTYREIVELLESGFVAVQESELGLSIGLQGLVDDLLTYRGDLTQITIGGLATYSELFFNRLQGLVRFHHVTGWPLATISKVYEALGSGDSITTDTSIVRFMNAHRVAERLGDDIVEVLPLWADIDTREMPTAEIASLYEKVFRHPSLRALDDQMPDPASLGGSTFDGKGQLLRAALRIDAVAYEQLTTSSNDLGLSGPVLGTDTMSIAGVTSLYARAKLGRALRMRVSDIMILTALADESAVLGSPAGTLSFLDGVERLDSADLSADELNYLLRHIDSAPGSNGAQETVVADAAVAVDAQVREAAAGTMPAESVTNEDVATMLARSLDAVRPEQEDAAARQAQIDTDVEKVLAVVGNADLTDLDANGASYWSDVQSIFGEVLGDTTTTQAYLVPPSPDALADCVGWFTPDAIVGSEAITGWTNQATGVAIAAPGASPTNEDGAVFDGVDDHLTITGLNHTGVDHTFVFGIDVAATPSTAVLFDVENDSGDHTTCMTSDGEGAFAYRHSDSSTETVYPLGPQRGGPQTLSFVFDGQAPTPTTAAYRDGQPVSVTPAYFEGVDAANATVRLGSSVDGDDFFAGTIHTVGIFNGKLTPAQLAQVHGRIAALAGRVEERRLFVYNALQDAWRRRRARDAAADAVASTLDLRVEHVAYLLDALQAVDDSNATLFEGVRPPAQSGHRAIDSGATYASRKDALTRLHKVAMLVDKLDLDLADLAWIVSSGSLDLNRLPVAANTDLEDDRARYAELQSLLETYELEPYVAAGREALYEIAGFDPALTVADMAAFVAERTRWSATDIEKLHVRWFGSTLSGVAPLTAMRTWAPAAEAVRKLGVSAGEAFGWLNPNELEGPQEATAAEIMRAVRARYTDEQWYEAARPIRDVLRAKQRDALVAHLVHTDANLESSDDLYEKLLLDVEMEPCALTTRVAAAIGSTQLFVHRSLLALEEHVRLNRDAAEQWEWRKSYVIWEANRKVFLYPENFIEPELRDDKTPIFKEAEAALREGPLDEERVEEVYGRYLEQLHEISQLDVVGVVHHEEASTLEDPSVNELHVFAQTPGGAPRTLYHRTWVDDQYWTPWQRIDLEAAARQFVPMVYNGQLRLFWLEATPGRYPSATGLDAPPEQQHPTLRLLSSYRVRDEWIAPKATEPFEAATMSEGLWLPKSETSRLALGTRLGTTATVELYYWMVKNYPSEPDANNPEIAARLHHLYDAPLDPCTGAMELIEEVPGEPEAAAFGVGISGVTKGVYRQTNSFSPFSSGEPVLQYPTTYVMFDKTVRLEDDDPYFPRGHYFVTKSGARVFATLSPMPSPIVETEEGTTPPTKGTGANWQVMAQSEAIVPNSIPALPFSSGTLEGATAADLHVEVFAPQALAFEPTHIPHQPLVTDEASVKVRFRSFEHKMICEARKLFNRFGTAGLRNYDKLKWPLQENRVSFFQEDLHPVASQIEGDYPSHEFDFTFDGAYSAYNWELFFHLPLLISQRYRAEGKFQEAVHWLHAILDPRDKNPNKPEAIWKFLPFRETVEAISDLQADVDTSTPASPLAKWLKAALKGDPDEVEAGFEAQLDQLERDPFNPHLIARMRHTAYQRAVIRMYIETLVEWGDRLFSRDTSESVAEALQIYVLAGQLLGRPPELIDGPDEGVSRTFFDIKNNLDSFSNAVVAEALIPSPNSAGPHPGFGPGTRMLFCTPSNPAQRELWDTVQDRLFKIRNCMNIDGVIRELPVFQPPIDPALLVRARAAGLDLQSVLDDLYAPPPLHRFSVLYQRAMDFTGYVSSLGQSLLSALEKKDAEHLTRLRTSHEISMLTLVRDTRKAQVAEAETSLEILRESKKRVGIDLAYYEKLIDDHLLPEEEQAYVLSNEASAGKRRASKTEQQGQAAAMIPDLNLGVAGMGPANFTIVGGSLFSRGIDLVASSMSMEAAATDDRARRLTTRGEQARRRQDWFYRLEAANEELAQIERQELAAEIRLDIAQKELASHERQREQAKEVEAFMKRKFTDTELYDWMVRELSALHYQAFELALKMARRAERAFQHERGEFDRRFIGHGYFEGSRKGLLAGERLQLDLRRMDDAYVTEDRRDLELTKHISLAEMSPQALLALRETGQTEIALTEDLFDLDYPGHYMRRIKSVAISLPAVTGPYSGVNCTLTLLQSMYRKDAQRAVDTGFSDTNPLAVPQADEPFVYRFNRIKSVCTSNGINDSGMFELNFRDERLLPFEGEGAVSKWRIELPQDSNRFDLRTLSDAVVHVQYMARDGGEPLRRAARAALADKYTQAMRLVSLRDEFAAAWEGMQTPVGGNHAMSFDMTGKLPFIPGGGDVEIEAAAIVFDLENGTELTGVVTSPGTPPAAPIKDGEVTTLINLPADANMNWSVTIPDTNTIAAVRDIYMLFTIVRQ